MFERGGDVMANVAPNVRRKTLEPIIRENVTEGSIEHPNELRFHLSLGRADYIDLTPSAAPTASTWTANPT